MSIIVRFIYDTKKEEVYLESLKDMCPEEIEQTAKRNMQKAAEFMARMFLKYGDEVLAEIEEKKKCKEGDI